MNTQPPSRRPVGGPVGRHVTVAGGNPDGRRGKRASERPDDRPGVRPGGTADGGPSASPAGLTDDLTDGLNGNPGDGTVGKALRVLDCVANAGRPMRFSELLALSPYPKATLYRFLQTLTNQQMLACTPDGAYWLGPRLMRLAHAAWHTASLAPIARPFVEALAAGTGEAVHLAQLDNGQVLFIDKLKLSDQFETLARVGQVAPAYCTGVGKCILAHLPPDRLDRVLQQQSFFRYTEDTIGSATELRAELARIRKRGYGFDRQEHEHGIISIAAPILDTGGRVLGALSIATSTARHGTGELEAFLPALLDCARKIGDEATWWHFPA